MTPTQSFDPDLAAWLGDIEGDAGPQALTQALNDWLSRKPDRRAVTRAAGRLRRSLEVGLHYYGVIDETPIGRVYLAVSERGLVAVDFGIGEDAFREELQARSRRAVVPSKEHTAHAARQIAAYLAGGRSEFDLPVDLEALTDFQQQVLLAALQVPRGQVATYGQIARRIGRPKAARAVGQALGQNPVPLVIPCHRVIAADGSLGGYSGGGGVKTKASLLRLEGVQL